MKVLYVAAEALPFAASGGLGDVAGSLPQALRRRMVGCRVVMPLYGSIPQALREKMTYLTSFTVPVAWRRQYCGVFEAKYGGVTYYLLDNEYYFKREGLYGHYDDAERFAFFSRAVLEMLPHIDFKPDILHCNDWQSALAVVYYTLFYANVPGYENIKTIFTIHNIQYQGVYGHELLNDVLGIPEQDYPVLAYDGDVNFMKGAIECANRVTTVSPTYANEILDPWYSHGLDSILRERSWKLSGILNGIDTASYDPETDSAIFFNYSAKDPANKAKNKQALQEYMALECQADAPLIGMVTRLVGHKGLDIVRGMADELLNTSNAQMAILGSGDWQYENFFRDLAARHPGRVSAWIGFVPDLARKIYAGSDMFLMPSQSEPCGLSQMVALRYGTIPIVRETGGLKDSITDSGDGKGNGFTFSAYDAGELLRTVRRALEGYSHPEGWQILVDRALHCDNSWAKSAGEYINLYKSVIAGN